MAQKSYYDIAVIGSGPGGYIAAITAAGLGSKVCLIEKKLIGGTCLNIGCIPTKTLLTTANILEKTKQAKDFGINVENISVDFCKIQQRKEKVVQTLRHSLENLIKSNHIDILRGEASFLSPTLLEIDGQEKSLVEAKKIIIASGSEPSEIKKFPFDHKFIHNSTSILSISELPKSLAIVGGGYIGCEFAAFFNALGVKVTIIEAMDSIIFSHDKDIREALTKIFINKGIEIILSAKLETIEKNRDHITLILDNKKQIKADLCLLSIGRKVCSSNLHLERAGVIADKDGKIIVDDNMQTNVPNIYAIGDVTGKFMLAHVASHQGIVAAHNASGHNMAMKYDAIPSVIFTLPEIASVGLCKNEAKQRGYDIISCSYPLSFLGKAIAGGETEGFVSLIVDKETHQILGANVIGPNASSMIAEMALAVNNELTIECIIDTVHAHPTMSEAWLEAALLANKTPLHHPPLKK